MKRYFKGKQILITGGTGSIGSEIVRQLLKYKPKTIRIYSRDEYKQYMMRQEMKKYRNLRYLIGDVRDKERLMMAMENIDIVYHTAAIKHVPIAEYNPFETVKTNVIGTQNVVDCALAQGVKLFIGISTDKAAEPVNVMGATKLLGEKIITSAMFYKGSKKTIFSSVRFGNVLGSRGSVIPLFINQIKKGGPVTVTDPEMTRFFITIPNAVQLIFKATKLTSGGEVFILKMPVIKLGDLVDVLIKYCAPQFGFKSKDIKVKIINPRPGEKHFELLLTEIESQFAVETTDMYIILPHPEFKVSLKQGNLKLYNTKKLQMREYSSRGIPLNKNQIMRLIKQLKIL
ncbi:polysaccharide biosynthesis protein [Candidatus Dependentiae bacterium]|nr:polysaccharide biosynthesis protein [Candidatus Dependentiae bacterium]